MSSIKGHAFALLGIAVLKADDPVTDFIDQPVIGVGFEVERSLAARRLLPRRRNGNDDSGGPAAGPQRAIQRLAILIERMMPLRRTIRRVENRLLIEAGQCPVSARNSRFDGIT